MWLNCMTFALKDVNDIIIIYYHILYTILTYIAFPVGELIDFFFQLYVDVFFAVAVLICRPEQAASSYPVPRVF